MLVGEQEIEGLAVLYSESLLLGTIEERLSRIRIKLAQVRELVKANPEKATAFGVKKHGFQLAPPLTLAEVSAFEEEHEISLPKDYRAFILSMGSSGAGPYYGLLPLSRWADVTGDEPGEDSLSQGCRLEPDLGKYWQRRVVEEDLEPYGGALPIVDQGCTYYALLVLNGPHRGKVVNVDLNGSPPVFVDNPDFLSWYERWLDEWQTGVDIFWFGFSPTGDETELCLMLESEGAAKAALALSRFSRLNEKTILALLDCLQSKDEELRAAAVKTIGHHGGEKKFQSVVALANDNSALVRRDVLWTLRKYFMHKVSLIKPVFAHALDDEDEEVLHYALMAYKELPFVDEGKIRVFIGDSREKIASMAKWVLRGYDK